MRNKIIYTVTLVSLISCSNFKPYVLTQAYIVPETRTVPTTYENLNFQQALFNQYASGLEYTLRLEYTNQIPNNINFGLVYLPNAVSSIPFQAWDIITPTYAEAEITGVWKQRLTQVFFDRNFDPTTKTPATFPTMYLRKWPGDSLNWIFKIESKISYSVNIGAVYLDYDGGINVSIDQFYIYNDFFNKNNELAQSVLLDTNRIGGSSYYNLGNVITDINRFDLYFQMVDVPPYTTGVSDIYITEFNVFTQSSDIKIPTDPEGGLFGWVFEAVEWWDFLGHAKNIGWWIVNKSPVAPVFEFIDTYIITWISGLIDFIIGVFNI